MDGIDYGPDPRPASDTLDTAGGMWLVVLCLAALLAFCCVIGWQLGTWLNG